MVLREKRFEGSTISCSWRVRMDRYLIRVKYRICTFLERLVRMKVKFALTTLVAFTLMASLCASANAAAAVQIYGYVDKAQYQSGEEGTLKIWIVNEGDEDLILQNISVVYPWNAYLPWEGNESLEKLGKVIVIDGNTTYEFDFTVPNDGRATPWGGSINVRVETDKDTEVTNIPMSIASPPTSLKVKDMDNVITLFTIQIIIAIIAALIIAAAVFLSGRRSGVAWQKQT